MYFGFYGNLKIPDLQWEKRKSILIAVLLQVFWQNIFRNVSWVVLHQA